MKKIQRGVVKMSIGVGMIVLAFGILNMGWIGPWLLEPEYHKTHLTWTGDPTDGISVSFKTPEKTTAINDITIEINFLWCLEHCK